VSPDDAPAPARARIEAFRALVRDDPGDPVSQLSLSLALAAAGQHAEAAAGFERAIALAPDYSAAHRGLGRAYEALGRREAAIAAYRAGIPIARAAGDLQTAKEMETFLARLVKAEEPPSD
jgi:tetratricopeptide (TPR) repeat protein